MKHKALVAQFLFNNFELFFQRFNTILIGSNSYLTKRQSIKLLGEILLDRANYTVMTEYVTRGDHLKLCMNLLRDDRKMIQYEGFHVFKVTHPILAKHELSANESTGIRGKSPQIRSRPQDLDAEPRAPLEIPAGLPRWPNRG